MKTLAIQREVDCTQLLTGVALTRVHSKTTLACCRCTKTWQKLLKPSAKKHVSKPSGVIYERAKRCGVLHVQSKLPLISDTSMSTLLEVRARSSSQVFLTEVKSFLEHLDQD